MDHVHKWPKSRSALRFYAAKEIGSYFLKSWIWTGSSIFFLNSYDNRFSTLPLLTKSRAFSLRGSSGCCADKVL